MKIGIISDAHGNAICLRLCLDYLKKANVKRKYFLGDAVGYCPDYNPVCSILRKEFDLCLLGNHDAVALDHIRKNSFNESIAKISYVKKGLTNTNRKFLLGLKPMADMKINNKHILLVHGSPWNPLEEYVYPDSISCDFASLNYDTIFMGHTHRPFISQVGNLLIVNVGSCGLPRDYGALASCVIYNTDKNEAQIIRIPLNKNEINKVYGKKIHKSILNVFERTEKNVIGKIINL